MQWGCDFIKISDLVRGGESGVLACARIFRRAAREQAHSWLSAQMRTHFCFAKGLLSHLSLKIKRTPNGVLLILAEGVGFEPTWDYSQTVFKTASL